MITYYKRLQGVKYFKITTEKNDVPKLCNKHAYVVL